MRCQSTPEWALNQRYKRGLSKHIRLFYQVCDKQ
ncbi:unnamed protein product, partial [Staurois parvus]